MPDETGAITIEDLILFLKPSRAGQLTQAQSDVATRFNEVYSFPEARMALDAYIRRPDCGSCKRDLATILAQDKDRLKTFTSVIDWNRAFRYTAPDEQDDLPGTDGPVREPASASPWSSGRPRPTQMAGQFRDIPDTPEAYQQLLRELNTANARFSGLAVRDLQEGQIRVYFY